MQVFQTDHGPILHSVAMPNLRLATSSATAIIIARNVYVCGGLSPYVKAAQLVQVYDLDKKKWTTLPRAPQYNSEAVAINNRLVLLGGQDSTSHAITNIVSTWTGEDWQQELPSMPSRRRRPGVTSHGTFVIVAGGRAEDDLTLLCSTHVLDTKMQQWWTPAKLQLPMPMYGMEITICATHVYVASARIRRHATAGVFTHSRSVWQLPVSALESMLVKEDPGPPHHWQEVTPTPYSRSALLQGTACPVAVGGHDDSNQPTSDIYSFDPHFNKWCMVGQLLEPRIRCTAVCVHQSSFLVLGGYSDEENPRNALLKSVELVFAP